MHSNTLSPLRRAVPLRDRIYDRLRKAILTGELAPGTPVIEAEMAARLGASRTPLREALRRLEAEGLLEPRGLRGTVVRELREEDVACIFEIREALESLAARRAARTIKPAQVAKLDEFVANMERAVDDAGEMERQDTAFHDLILNVADGERLKRMLTELREELIAYRFLSLSDLERRRASVLEHRAIAEALRAHDERAAGRATAEHIANAQAAVLALAAARRAAESAS